jgi:hypothetical protein
MSRIFQNENPAPKQQRSLKMVVSIMVISFTLSLLSRFQNYLKSVLYQVVEEEAVVF